MPRAVALVVKRIAILATFLVIYNASPAHAIESFGIGAVPANPRADNPRTQSIFVYELAPNKTVEDGIKVINNAETAKTIAIYPVDSQASSDGAFACAQQVDERKGVGSWIKLAKSEVTLQPHSSEVVPFTVAAPDQAEVGEHNGCIALQDTSREAKSEQGGIVLTFRSALRVAVTVPGKVDAKLQFEEIKMRDLSATKLQVSPVLDNQGNVSLDTKLRVRLLGLFGIEQVKAESDFPVLPKTKSQFNFELTKPFWGGWYFRVAEAEYLPLADNGKADAKRTKLEAAGQWIFVAPQPAALAILIGVPILLAAGVVGYIWYRRKHSLNHVVTKNYAVRRNEDIQIIADKFGLKWRHLAKLNNLKAPYTLREGQTIAIPISQLAKKEKPKTKR